MHLSRLWLLVLLLKELSKMSTQATYTCPSCGEAQIETFEGNVPFNKLPAWNECVSCGEIAELMDKSSGEWYREKKRQDKRRPAAAPPAPPVPFRTRLLTFAAKIIWIAYYRRKWLLVLALVIVAAGLTRACQTPDETITIDDSLGTTISGE